MLCQEHFKYAPVPRLAAIETAPPADYPALRIMFTLYLREEKPVLVARLSETEWRLHNRTKAVEHWFRLCRWEPKEFQKLVET